MPNQPPDAPEVFRSWDGYKVALHAYHEMVFEVALESCKKLQRFPSAKPLAKDLKKGLKQLNIKIRTTLKEKFRSENQQGTWMMH
jgi:hypothetical protein